MQREGKSMSENQKELPSLETDAYRAIIAARNFAADWWQSEPEIEPSQQSRVYEALGRLDEGTLFSFNDDETWPLIEEALVSALNTCKSGYGDYAARKDTRYDQLFTSEQEHLRRLMESWKSLRNARQRLLDRQAAQEIARKMGG